MTASGYDLSARVAEMRREFDAGFARPPAVDPPTTEPLLRILAGGNRYFVRLRDLACVMPCTVVVPIPGARKGLLGLAAVRGQVLPLYSLSTVLNLPGLFTHPRWILVVAGSAAGLGVEAVEGVSRIPEAAVREVSTGARRERGGAAVLQDSTGSRELLDVVSVVADMRKSLQPSEQER